MERLSKTAQNELMNIVTIFLGLSVGCTATVHDTFLTLQTLAIIVPGPAWPSASAPLAVCCWAS